MAGVADYCRHVEAYLCRKNDGHLIRIVGPAFEQVCSWADRGVPLSVVARGIDRYFDRYYAKGPRRRPVRIEFCEADVLDAFDQWRRALGITAARAAPAGDAAATAEEGQGGDGGEAASSPAATRRHQSLPAHLERVVARLTAQRSGQDRSLDSTLDAIVREIDAARAGARSLRGEARQALIARLRALDRVLLDAAYARCDGPTLQSLAAEADTDLAPFRGRMAPETYEQSRRAAIDRLLRERHQLPIVAFE